MKTLIWITFDLGVRGDYEGMYEFLDTYAAKECGDSAAALLFEFGNNLIAELNQQLAAAVTLDKKSRIYVVFPDDKGKYKGRFIVGRRKRPPWTGYGAAEVEEEDSGE